MFGVVWKFIKAPFYHDAVSMGGRGHTRLSGSQTTTTVAGEFIALVNFGATGNITIVSATQNVEDPGAELSAISNLILVNGGNALVGPIKDPVITQAAGAELILYHA